MTDIRIGTSGWSYPTGRGKWNGLFYPARRSRGFDELAYYAERFDTVEVNSSFYRLPEPATAASWVTRTPRRFEFAVKLYQKFTHPDMYLARDGVVDWDLSRDDFDLFRRGVEPIAAAGRLAALLVQFPASFQSGPDALGYLEWLLGALSGYPLAVELRHRSWTDAETDTAACLDAFKASWVFIDEPKFASSIRQQWREPASDGGLVYVRLHGRNAAAWWQHEKSEDRYNYLYTPEELAPFADAARDAAAARRKVLLYMNNHFSAKSVANAVILKRQLGQPIPGEYPLALVDRYPELDGVVATSGLRL